MRFCFLLIVCTIFTITSVAAQGVLMSPTRLFFTGNPGETVTETVLLNNSSVKDYTLSISYKYWERDENGNHKVSFLLFEDKNYNGLLDNDEAVLPNEVVKLNDFVAITDKNGKVSFQNVPTGDYKLKVNESADARLMMYIYSFTAL